MTSELNEVLIGFDLCYDFSQMTFYHQNNTEPMTVSSVPGEEKHQFPTPRDLFPLIEQRAELGIALLSNFFKNSFEKLSSIGPVKRMIVMVTMEKMKPVWARAIVQALEMLDIDRESVYLQDHMESFFYYTLSQKKEFWHYNVALFEYDREGITAYELRIDYSTKPAFVNVEKRSRLHLDKKARGGQENEEWNRNRDRLFLNQAQKMMGNEPYSSVYLIGDDFSKEWMQKSLLFLCRKRHVFMGKNLYTRGACYGVMDQTGIQPIGAFLYNGPDMIEFNIGMRMQVRGQETYHNMITAGVSYYMAHYECEFLLDNTHEIELYSRSMKGEQMIHTVQLTNLPERPGKATRIRMSLEFTARNRCSVKLDDLGLGDLYPTAGKKWEALLEL